MSASPSKESKRSLRPKKQTSNDKPLSGKTDTLKPKPTPPEEEKSKRNSIEEKKPADKKAEKGIGGVMLTPAKATFNGILKVGGWVGDGFSYMTGTTGKSKKKEKNEGVEPIKVDMANLEALFDSQGFDEKLYAKKLFETNQQEQIKLFVDSALVEGRGNAAKRLQDSVHQNYKTFITTSKEISNLEVDMLELRNHLTEVSSNLKDLQSVTVNNGKTPIRQQARHSYEESSLIRDIHWLLELPDELDILISERLFDEAVVQVERVNSLKKSPHIQLAYSCTKEHLDARLEKLSESLTKELQNPALKKSESRTVISYLSRLGFSKKAREIFLATRSTKIQNEIKKLRYDNNAFLYINELTRVVFTGIDSTCDDFLHCFKDKVMISGFVVWTIHEVSNILTHLRRQVFYSNEIENFGLVAKCFDIIKEHCKMLEARGLSLTFYLRQTFHHDLTKFIQQYHSRMESTATKQINEESWEAKKMEYNGETFYVSESCKHVESVISKFIKGVVCVWSNELVPVVVNTFTSILLQYVSDLEGIISTHTDLNDSQRLVIAASAYYIANNSCNSIVNQITKQTKTTSIPENDNFRKRLQNRSAEISNKFAEEAAIYILENVLEFEHLNYGFDSLEEEKVEISRAMVSVFEYLSVLANDMSGSMGPTVTKALQTQIWETIVMGMDKSEFWAREMEEAMFGAGGLQQFVLDVKFLVEASTPFAGNTREKLMSFVDRAVLNYCTANKMFDVKQLLKSEKWERPYIKAAITLFRGKSASQSNLSVKK